MAVIQNNRRVNFASTLNQFSRTGTLYNTLDLSLDEGYLQGYRYSGVLRQIKIRANFFSTLKLSIITGRGRIFDIGEFSSTEPEEFLEGLAESELIVGYGSRLIIEALRDIPPNRSISVFGAIEELGFPSLAGDGTGVSWGLILGNIQNQQDLISLLNTKLNESELAEALEDFVSQDDIPGIIQPLATKAELEAIELLPGPKGDKGDKGDRGDVGPQGLAGGIAEFHYYGSALPSSPADGQTWRETTIAGRFVGDWVWVTALSRWVSTFARFSEVPVNIWSAGGGVNWINYAWPRPLALGAYRASLIFTTPDSIANHHTVDIRFAELTGSANSYPHPTLLQPTHSIPRPNGVNQPAIWVSGWQIVSNCWHMRGQIAPVGTAPAFYGRLFCEQREVRP